MNRSLWATFGLMACSGGAPEGTEAVPTGPRDFSLVVQANVHGDIEPCG